MKINIITNIDGITIQFTTETDKIEIRKVITIETLSYAKTEDENRIIAINNSEILQISESNLNKLLSALE